MKFRSTVVCLMLVVVCLCGCGKNERIEGQVQDIFGTPVKGVTVKIQKSTFTSITDDSGRYSLDYAPGGIKLIFSKDGLTTNNLDLNIQQKSHYPAETITLYPIPQEKGLFYIDTENKRLVKMTETSRTEEEKIITNNKTFSMTQRYGYYIKPAKPSLTIKYGKSSFIDRNSYPTNIARMKSKGLVYEGDLNMFERKDHYWGFLKDTSSIVGDEKLLVRSVELTTGTYAWVKMFESNTIGIIPEKMGAASVFQVGVSEPRRTEFKEITFSSIANADLITTHTLWGSDSGKTDLVGSSVDGRNLFSPGSIFVGKTRNKRPCKFLVEQYGDDLVISWITYSQDGNIYSEGTNLTIHGINGCDLDNGVETSVKADSADFTWWPDDRQDIQDILFRPVNGAGFNVTGDVKIRKSTWEKSPW